MSTKKQPKPDPERVQQLAEMEAEYARRRAEWERRTSAPWPDGPKAMEQLRGYLARAFPDLSVDDLRKVQAPGLNGALLARLEIAYPPAGRPEEPPALEAGSTPEAETKKPLPVTCNATTLADLLGVSTKTLLRWRGMEKVLAVCPELQSSHSAGSGEPEWDTLRAIEALLPAMKRRDREEWQRRLQ